MKVLHVCETIRGGVATYLRMFHHALHDVVDSVFVIPAQHRDDLDPSIAVRSFDHSGRGPASIGRLARVAMREARAFNPDVILFHSTFSLGAMGIMRLRGVPGAYVYCPHAWSRLRFSEQPAKRFLVAAVEGRLAGLSDTVLNISRNDRALASSNGYRGHHVVVENALSDVSSTTGDPPFEISADTINLLFVGRFDRQKGLDILLDALSDARSRNPALRLHVIGAKVQDGPDIDRDMTRDVTFHSWVPPERLVDFYAHADAVVLPSRWEGLPMVLIESLRAGTPVLLSSRSGMGELIDDRHAGRVLPLSRKSFAEALSELDREELAVWRAGARRTYERRYSEARFRTETLAVLEDAIKRARSPRGAQR